MLLITQEEEHKPSYKTMYLPIGVYVRLEAKKKPTETLGDLINRLLEEDEKPLDQLHLDMIHLNAHHLKTQQVVHDLGVFGIKRAN